MNFERVESNLGYKFNDKKLLKKALTLASADAEDNNQTMEFFGDAILEFLVSERIYDENSSEGELTERRKLFVSDKALTPVSEKLGLDRELIKGAGDSANKKSVPSAYEAVLAAIYFDGGLDEARAFVNRTIDFTSVPQRRNYKGELQELLQNNGNPLPVYEYEDIGTPQAPKFRSRTVLFGKVFEGVADNKKQADQLAAKEALKVLNK